MIIINELSCSFQESLHHLKGTEGEQNLTMSSNDNHDFLIKSPFEEQKGKSYILMLKFYNVLSFDEKNNENELT